MGKEGKVANAQHVISQLPLGATGSSLPGSPGIECQRHLVVLSPIGEGAGVCTHQLPAFIGRAAPRGSSALAYPVCPPTGRAAPMTRNNLQVKKCGCWQLEVGSLCISEVRRGEVFGALAAIFKHLLLPFLLRDFSVIK